MTKHHDFTLVIMNSHTNLYQLSLLQQHYPSKDEQVTETEGEYSHAQEYLEAKEGTEAIRTLSKSEWEALCEF